MKYWQYSYLRVPDDMPRAGLGARRLVARVARRGVELHQQHREGLPIPQVAAKVLHSLRRWRLPCVVYVRNPPGT